MNESAIMINDIEKLKEKAEKFAEEDRLDESFKLFKQVVKISPSDYDSWMSMANISFHTGDIPSAVKYYIETTLIDPESRESAMSLCYTLIEAGKSEESKEVMDAYLSQRKGLLIEVVKSLKSNMYAA